MEKQFDVIFAQEFVIPGTLRIKKNSRRIINVWQKRRGQKSRKIPKIIPSEAYIRWEKEARASLANELRVRGGNFFPISGPVWVEAVMYYSGQRFDLSGALESVGDAFEDYLWENDKQIVSWDGSRVEHDKSNPRTVLTVRALRV